MNQQNIGANWLLSLTMDELVTLNGIMYGLELAIEKERLSGPRVMMILNISRKVYSLKMSASEIMKGIEDGDSKT